MTRLILASGSPRRLELLRSIGLDPEVIPSRIPEQLESGESPEDYVTRLARQKADAVARDHPERWILAADTVVVLGNRILEKPADAEDARRMLRALSGNVHTVFTGVSLTNISRMHSETMVARTDVRVSPMSADEISWYVSRGESMDKAGAYAAQGIGALLIDHFDGSYSNVVGLPLANVYRMMKRAGIYPPEESE